MAQVVAGLLGALQDRSGIGAGFDLESIEEGGVADLETGLTQTFGADRRQAVDTVAIRCKPTRAVVNGIERGDIRQQYPAKQMLELAFSRRMCCSRVCSAMRRLLPRASTDTPMMRPGTERLCSSRVAKNAACGRQAIGTPKRCEEPRAMSAPISPGDFQQQQCHQIRWRRR